MLRLDTDFGHLSLYKNGEALAAAHPLPPTFADGGLRFCVGRWSSPMISHDLR